MLCTDGDRVTEEKSRIGRAEPGEDLL
jgi:hypothetical protein